MHENLNQKISLLLDDELGKDEAIQLMHKIHCEPELVEKLRRYDAISQAIKSEVYLPITADFVSRVNSQIQQEVTYLIPKQSPPKRRYVQLYAAAASIAVIAVLVSQGLYKPAESDVAYTISGIKSVQNHSSATSARQLAEAKPENPSAARLARQEATQTFKTRGSINGHSKQLSGNSAVETIEIYPEDFRFNNYLHAHNGNMFSSGENYRDFVEFANYQQ